jgi:hypothetical protein
MKPSSPTTAAEAGREEKGRKHPPPPNGNSSSHRPHPRPSRRPDDPNSLRPPSSHRRRDPTKLSDRDRERHRERRERPPGERRPRPRSNSESSIPNDRSHRRKEGDGHIHKSKSRPHKDDKKDDGKKSGTATNGKRRLHPVDKIDLLDVTGLYGSHGCIHSEHQICLYLVFHHDGPFDACRPHRNKHSHKAPVAAFPANSLTNTLAGGLGEVPALDRDKFFGLTPQEAFQDYGHIAPVRPRRTSEPENSPVRSSKEDNTGISSTEVQKVRPTIGIRNASFDPRLKTEPVHGVESAGLGTSTFLEGAPAPKSAIERAAAIGEDEDGGALNRKKSLVQKIKAGRRGTGTGERPPLPPPPAMPGSLLSPAGTTPLDSAYNPVFKEGQFIERVENLPNAPSSRERADSGGSDKGGVAGSGLLGRVKSLKISSGARKGRKSDE